MEVEKVTGSAVSQRELKGREELGSGELGQTEKRGGRVRPVSRKHAYLFPTAPMTKRSNGAKFEHGFTKALKPLEKKPY